MTHRAVANAQTVERLYREDVPSASRTTSGFSETVGKYVLKTAIVTTTVASAALFLASESGQTKTAPDLGYAGNPSVVTYMNGLLTSASVSAPDTCLQSVFSVALGAFVPGNAWPLVPGFIGCIPTVAAQHTESATDFSQSTPVSKEEENSFLGESPGLMDDSFYKAGVDFYEQGKLLQAFEQFQKCLTLHSDLNPKDLGLARLYRHLGMVSFDQQVGVLSSKYVKRKLATAWHVWRKAKIFSLSVSRIA